MKDAWIVLALSCALVPGCGVSTALRAPAGAGSPPAATSPTASEPRPSAPLAERILQEARHYRGNPPWLGALTGALLAAALGLGLVTLRRVREDRRRVV
jgi:hypothetical protein